MIQNESIKENQGPLTRRWTEELQLHDIEDQECPLQR